MPQPGSVSFLNAAHERPNGLCFELLKRLFSVPQVVLKQSEGGLGLYEHALDLDVWGCRIWLLLLLVGMLTD